MKKDVKINYHQKEYNDIVQQMKEINLELDRIQKNFDFYTDFDLIDSCIYEMLSLKSRYKYLLKKIKSENNNENQEECNIQME